MWMVALLLLAAVVVGLAGVLLVWRSPGRPRPFLDERGEPLPGRLGVGTTHETTSVLEGIVLASLRFPELTLGEKVNLWRDKASAGVSAIWSDMGEGAEDPHRGRARGDESPRRPKVSAVAGSSSWTQRRSRCAR